MIIKVVPYSTDWPNAYKAEKTLLLNNLGSLISNLYHIGSTSVEGLSAKPIIDMILETPSLAQLDSASDQFQELGYEIMGEFGIKGRRYYRKGGDHRTHQIHAFAVGDDNIKRHIAFRDYLKAHPVIMKEYEMLKIRLADECDNMDSYCDGKDDFIKFHEANALKWGAETNLD